jgi:hypothetical protein
MAAGNDGAGEGELAEHPDAAARPGERPAVADGHTQQLQLALGLDVEDAVDAAAVDHGVDGVAADDRHVVPDVEVAGGAQVFAGARQAEAVGAGVEEDEVGTVRGVGGLDGLAQRTVVVAGPVRAVGQRGRDEDRGAGGGHGCQQREGHGNENTGRRTSHGSILLIGIKPG